MPLRVRDEFRSVERDSPRVATCCCMKARNKIFCPTVLATVQCTCESSLISRLTFSFYSDLLPKFEIVTVSFKESCHVCSSEVKSIPEM